MWRFFAIVFLILLGLNSCGRDPYEDLIDCSRDRNTNDYEGKDQCMRERGWNEENTHEPLFDRPTSEIQEEQPLSPLDFEPDRENYGDN